MAQTDSCILRHWVSALKFEPWRKCNWCWWATVYQWEKQLKIKRPILVKFTKKAKFKYFQIALFYTHDSQQYGDSITHNPGFVPNSADVITMSLSTSIETHTVHIDVAW